VSERDVARAAFDAYTGRLVAQAGADDRVVGVILLGSGADPERIDAWSDHDIALVARPEAVEVLRESVAWLPDGDGLAVVGRAWHDGFAGVFDDGRVIEYAVTDLAALRTFPMTAAHVLFDRGGVAEAVDAAIAATETRRISAPDGLAAALLVELLVGVGRVRRGERLSGGDVIRSEAALTFVDLWLAVCRPGERHPDPFNGWRRIETRDPALTAVLDDLLAQPAEAAARGILALAEDVVAPVWPGWPTAGADAVRRRLGWD
jgi:hypothetical protein